LLLHEVGEDAGVGGEAGEGDAVVGVDGDDFALVGGEFFCVALYITCKYDDCQEGGRWGDGGSTFIAARTAWVLLTMPTTTEPCFTASCAYSTWKMRPWGELVSYVSDCSASSVMLFACGSQGDGVVVVVVSKHLGGLVKVLVGGDIRYVRV